MVAGITELWVENSQKINCRDVMSIREGRVLKQTLCAITVKLKYRKKRHNQELINPLFPNIPKVEKIRKNRKNYSDILKRNGTENTFFNHNAK